MIKAYDTKIDLLGEQMVKSASQIDKNGKRVKVG